MCQCVCVCVCARARFFHVCCTPNNVAYEFAGIFFFWWEYYEGHSIGSLCSLHYSIFCHQEQDLSLSLSLSHTLSHTHTHITSPHFMTNVRTLSSEVKLYLQPSTIPQRHYKAGRDKPNTFLTSGLNVSKVSVSRSGTLTPGVESLLALS
jgi:hypothetical protein